MREHPWASKKTATRIASDHAKGKRKYPTKHKTTTKKGKTEYQKHLMRDRLGISKERFGKIGRKPKRFLLRDFVKHLEKV